MMGNIMKLLTPEKKGRTKMAGIIEGNIE